MSSLSQICTLYPHIHRQVRSFNDSILLFTTVLQTRFCMERGRLGHYETSPFPSTAPPPPPIPRNLDTLLGQVEHLGSSNLQPEATGCDYQYHDV